MLVAGSALVLEGSGVEDAAADLGEEVDAQGGLLRLVVLEGDGAEGLAVRQGSLGVVGSWKDGVLLFGRLLLLALHVYIMMMEYSLILFEYCELSLSYGK